MYESEFTAYVVFGVILNFIFSFAFAIYLSKNIGTTEMILLKGDKKQPWWMPFLLVVPFAKMALTLYRVTVLQLFFLNRGYSHKDYWIYLTNDH